MSQSGHEQQPLSALTLAALGVVFGDIGTSPLYALKEAFSNANHPLPVTELNVFGILSLIVWTLIIVVTLKYVVVVLRADNHGEGGVVALMARVVEQAKGRPRKRTVAVMLGLFGAALFYGDGVITPAISVLSAVEGLEVVTPAFKPFVSCLLRWSFSPACSSSSIMARRASAASSGPIVMVWFASLGLIGIHNIVAHPQVLAALSPWYAAKFFLAHPIMGYFALGAVFLTVTGGEALYADMGHFGKKPIRIAWLSVVLPSLLLNYFGQGALVIENPLAAANPFFLGIPTWGLMPMVLLATAATVIASQALITGAFSMTRELIQLGLCPRLAVRHTSGAQIGQIYVPFINWLLLLLVVAVVATFKTSSNLAAAYGIAVTLTMLVTSILAFSVARRDWNWSTAWAVSVFLPLVMVELFFLASNAAKIMEGGWFPLAFGALILMLLTTWRTGRALLSGSSQRKTKSSCMPFVEMLANETSMPRVPHTAVVFSRRALTASPMRCCTTSNTTSCCTRRQSSSPSPSSRYRVLRRGNALTAGGAHPSDTTFLSRQNFLYGFHGRARRTRRSGVVRRAGPRRGDRADDGVVFPQPRNTPADAGAGHGAVARTPLRIHVPQRLQRRQLLQAATQPRGGAG